VILTADAIVVLGCAIREGGVPSPALARRIQLGARLFHHGAASRVIASGGRRWGEHVEALVIERGLREAGVTETAVVLELCSLTTLENGCYTAELLRVLGGSRALVATCSWHMPRALENFRRWGIDARPPPADWLDGGTPSASVRIREGVCAWADSVMMPRAR
jgi:uncharacterized SAM-binding protein YcdF (DUF218 family)